MVMDIPNYYLKGSANNGDGNKGNGNILSHLLNLLFIYCNFECYALLIQYWAICIIMYHIL